MFKYIWISLLLVGAANADEFNLQQAEDVSVMVGSKINNTLGSGIAIKIDGNLYVVTAAHMLEHYVLSATNDVNPFNRQAIRVELPELMVMNNGQKEVGVVVATNVFMDLTLLKLEKPVSTHFATLSNTLPVKAHDVHYVGCFNGEDGEDSYSRGYISKPQRLWDKQDDLTRYIIQVDCIFTPCASGGPIFCNDNKCYGMAFAISQFGTTGYCASSVDILKWIKSLELK